MTFRRASEQRTNEMNGIPCSECFASSSACIDFSKAPRAVLLPTATDRLRTDRHRAKLEFMSCWLALGTLAVAADSAVSDSVGAAEGGGRGRPVAKLGGVLRDSHIVTATDPHVAVTTWLRLRTKSKTSFRQPT